MPPGTVDITAKHASLRTAEAHGRLRLRKSTLRLIRTGKVPKGDPCSVAVVAGVQAAKRTFELIPYCHQIPLTSVTVLPKIEEDAVSISTQVKANYSTGVEMEALTACSVALLTFWDMVKELEKDVTGGYPDTKIESVEVTLKSK